MTSWPRKADLPISHMPMQPSTHVTHMPEVGTIEPGVRFLVSVAAVALILDNVIAGPLLCGSPDLAGDARLHEAHHVVETGLAQAGWRQVGAAAADRALGIRIGAAQAAGGADVAAA